MTTLPFPDEVRDRVRSYIQHQGAKSPEAIVELVRASQERFLAVIADVSDEVAAGKPAADEWSVRELTRHVLDAQASVLSLVHALSRGLPPPGGGGAGRLAEDEGKPFAALVDDVRALNQRLLDEIAGMPAEPDLSGTAVHPFFGALHCKEWAAFQRVHDEDHVQHAQKILAGVGGGGR